MSISAGEDERCVPEWYSLASPGPPHPVIRKELISAYHLVSVNIRNRFNLVSISLVVD